MITRFYLALAASMAGIGLCFYLAPAQQWPVTRSGLDCSEIGEVLSEVPPELRMPLADIEAIIERCRNSEMSQAMLTRTA
ncbi:hypothetical protein SynSYN20_01621 [Synechococcus sp. SYN20]|uniref:hypothetical protein n=1 Tax=Synechococcus sp. SYN20 TaxID=1050714 RepID=UPI0016472843|nr:hypothetical protein [Synechococcus sp. SYN20]QNJ25948.1 hypothetical protein SynSYN20_01621 [Synechococcus sp. SYN20]